MGLEGLSCQCLDSEHALIAHISAKRRAKMPALGVALVIELSYHAIGNPQPMAKTKLKQPEVPAFYQRAVHLSLMPDDVKPCARVVLGENGKCYLTQQGAKELEEYRQARQAWESQITGTEAKEFFGYTREPYWRHRSADAKCGTCAHALSSHPNKEAYESGVRLRCSLGKFAVTYGARCSRYADKVEVKDES